MSYAQELLEIKNGIRQKTTGVKPKKPLRKIGLKKAEEIKTEKEIRGNDDTQKEKWFQARRKEMVGVCQCGCGEPSSKNDNTHFRSSICHVFPQRLFESIQYHRLNWVERKFWATNGTSACHSQMDNQSMGKWVNFADWDNIKEIFYKLSPLLTYEERKTKFYTHFEKLVYNNQ